VKDSTQPRRPDAAVGARARARVADRPGTTRPTPALSTIARLELSCASRCACSSSARLLRAACALLICSRREAAFTCLEDRALFLSLPPLPAGLPRDVGFAPARSSYLDRRALRSSLLLSLPPTALSLHHHTHQLQPHSACALIPSGTAAQAVADEPPPIVLPLSPPRSPLAYSSQWPLPPPVRLSSRSPTPSRTRASISLRPVAAAERHVDLVLTSSSSSPQRQLRRQLGLRGRQRRQQGGQQGALQLSGRRRAAAPRRAPH